MRTSTVCDGRCVQPPSATVSPQKLCRSPFCAHNTNHHMFGFRHKPPHVWFSPRDILLPAPNSTQQHPCHGTRSLHPPHSSHEDNRQHSYLRPSGIRLNNILVTVQEVCILHIVHMRIIDSTVIFDRPALDILLHPDVLQLIVMSTKHVSKLVSTSAGCLRILIVIRLKYWYVSISPLMIFFLVVLVDF